MNNKFIYSPKKSLFEKKLAAGQIGEESIVFIEDTKEIWNRGHYFGMVGSGSGIDPEVLSGIETAIATLQSDKADKSELSDYALKSELPSLDGYLTKTVADGLYATVAQYNALNQTVGNIQTELSNKATKDELSTGLAGKLDNSAADGFVPTTRKVNGVALDQDITITATDPNAATKEELSNVNTDLQTFKNNVALTYATDQDVADAVAALVDSSPTTLDTLNELAAALGDDPNFATTVAAQIGTKADQTALDATNTNVANLTTKVNGNSVSKSGETLTVSINGSSQSLTNTWRGISDAVDSTSTSVSASSKAVKTAYDAAVAAQSAANTAQTTANNKWTYNESTIKGVKVNNAGNADTVGGFTVGCNVPANAKFTDNDTHYTTGINAGATGATSNSAQTNPYVTVKDNSTHRGQIRLVGGGATTVTSDASGNITISSTDTNTHPDLSSYAKKTDIPSIPSLSGGSAAESGKYVSGVTVSGHAITVTKGTLPTIPSVGNGTVTIKQNGTTKGTFTMNQSGNTTIELTDTNTHPTVGNGTVTIKQNGVSKGSFTMNQSGNTTIELTDNNTTYSLSSLGIGNVKNYDQSKAIKSITRSGTTFTYTCLDGTTGTFTQQDNNTTYSLGSFGITATAAELNYTDGVTSNIQTQLNGKQATISDLSTIRSNASNGATAYSKIKTNGDGNSFLADDGTYKQMNTGIETVNVTFTGTIPANTTVYLRNSLTGETISSKTLTNNITFQVPASISYTLRFSNKTLQQGVFGTYTSIAGFTREIACKLARLPIGLYLQTSDGEIVPWTATQEHYGPGLAYFYNGVGSIKYLQVESIQKTHIQSATILNNGYVTIQNDAGLFMEQYDASKEESVGPSLATFNAYLSNFASKKGILPLYLLDEGTKGELSNTSAARNKVIQVTATSNKAVGISTFTSTGYYPFLTWTNV